MQKIILLNKKIGQTPLECVEELRIKNSHYAKATWDKQELRGQKMGYAGRLDPMAEGLLLVMVGEECKNREKYQRLDKEYVIDVLFGICTDSYDLLGIPVRQMIPADFKQIFTDQKIPTDIKKVGLEKLFKQFRGKMKQKLPPYSAHRIGKHMMYKLARDKKLDLDNLPEKEVEIYNLQLLDKYFISSSILENLVIKRIGLVKGNFRQEEILDSWRNFFQTNNEKSFPVIKISVSCSSGTYMRTIANNLGIKTGVGALALNIKRTRIGKYTLEIRN
jgi:tRNA pseudouridine55 synthase